MCICERAHASSHKWLWKHRNVFVTFSFSFLNLSLSVHLPSLSPHHSSPHSISKPAEHAVFILAPEWLHACVFPEFYKDWLNQDNSFYRGPKSLHMPLEHLFPILRSTCINTHVQSTISWTEQTSLTVSRRLSDRISIVQCKPHFFFPQYRETVSSNYNNGSHSQQTIFRMHVPVLSMHNY